MIDVLLYGVLRGALFALASFGFALVLGVLGIVNMTHGLFIVLGAVLTHALHAKGIFLPAAMAIAVLATGLFAVLLHKGFIERVFKQNPLMVLVQTFGLSIVVTRGLEIWLGSGERLVRADVPGLPIVEIGPAIIPTIELVLFAAALLSAFGLMLVLDRTDFGRALRACRDSPRSAALLGIDVDAVYTRTMLVCGLWAGLAGALVIGIKPIAPYMHLHWTVDAFLIVIIGGQGSMLGVLLGGFLYGLLNYIAFFYYPSIAPALVYGALVAVLVLRPQGLFGLGTVVRK
ncbi:branched-chain amino acid ABC transporter permease [Pseudorhodoferax sp.]|uniref:branched-chain amino acid ABC transporter permease n=1 Tax=Pseudorhodoferax sp. TaxID=1993553 RepID=UPI002DD68111|nr:branched-chain amino acid ABC transporter permease [Pseudorhodoferax sp.]